MFRAGLLLVIACLSAASAQRPVVIAHRGGAALRPENTIVAFQHALRMGVPVLEFDMNVTADGEVVIHHDSTVNARICTPVQGAAARPGPIALLRLAEIRQFDCGSSTRANSPGYVASPGQRMPTLDEFLASVKDSQALLLGETKIAPNLPPPGAVHAKKFIDLVYEVVRRYGVESRFILQSADYDTIDAMHAKNRKIGLCLLNARRFKPGYLEVARRHKATHLMLRAEDVTADQVRQLQAAGLKIFSGTANTATEWQKYVELGVDGILTDDPQGLMSFLAQRF